MQVGISSGPAFAFGTVEVGPGAEVKVEAGAMAAMTGDVTIETQATGGLLGGLEALGPRRGELLHQHVPLRCRRPRGRRGEAAGDLRLLP